MSATSGFGSLYRLVALLHACSKPATACWDA